MKKVLRAKYLQARENMSSTAIETSSIRIVSLLTTLLQTQPTCTVGIYYPTQGEPNVLSLMQRPELGSFKWALPVCNVNGTLDFASCKPHCALQSGRYGIPIPAQLDWVQPQIVLIPCLAFNRTGARLGYGAGWYDKTFDVLRQKPLTVGVAFGISEEKESFQEPHDHLLNFVVTETELISPAKSS